MKYSLDTLSDRLSALALFRGVLETDVTAKLLKLVGAARDKNPGDFYGLWGSFTSALYAEGGDLGLFVIRISPPVSRANRCLRPWSRLSARNLTFCRP